MKTIYKLLVIILFSICSNNLVWADTHPAATCENKTGQLDVQAAITASSTGDTVTIPIGNCIWDTTLSITSTKKIILQGAGMESTVITGSGTVIDMTTSGSRVTGIGIIDGQIMVDGDGWRIDHCSFTYSVFSTGVFVRGTRAGLHPTGLVDNCSFHNGRVIVAIGMLLSEGNDQHQIWAKPLNLGSTDNTVFVEDCTCTFTVFGNIIDENYGGGYTFRYNTLTDSGVGANSGAYIEAHSVQGNNRGSRKWEIYGNILNNTGGSIYYPFRIRSGTGAIFYNSIIGTWTNDGIGLDNVRSASGDVDDNTTGEGRCDGDSAWDGNEDATGYPCRDQTGRGGDASLWTYPPAGAYTQTLMPAYAWINRTESNVEAPFQVIAGSTDHIKTNRDFYNYAVSFDGTIGVGCGTLASRPATCTIGVGYWATNQSCSDLTEMVGANPTTPISGTLYKCTATNTWTSYYIPYTYPHPLRGPFAGTATLSSSGGVAVMGGSGTITIGN